MSNLELIKQKLKKVGYSSFEDWMFDFRNQGGKTINYYVTAKSDSGKIKEKGFFFDPTENPELWNNEDPEKGMEAFRKHLLDNLSEFIG